MRKKLSLLFFSSLISFFLIELFLRFFLPQDLSTPWRVYLDNGLLLNKDNGKAFHYFKGQKKLNIILVNFIIENINLMSLMKKF